MKSWATGQAVEGRNELPHNSPPGLLPGGGQVTRSTPFTRLGPLSAFGQGPFRYSNHPPAVHCQADLVNVVSSRCGHRMECRHSNHSPGFNVNAPVSSADS